MRNYTDDQDFAVEGFMNKYEEIVNLNGEDEASITLEGFQLKSVVEALETIDATELRAKIRALRKKNSEKQEKANEAYRQRNEAFEKLEQYQQNEGKSSDELMAELKEAKENAEFGAKIIQEAFEVLLRISQWEDGIDEAKRYAEDKHSELLDKMYASNQQESEENESTNNDDDLESLI